VQSLLFLALVAFFGGFDIGASLMESFAGFSFEVEVKEIVGFCILGSSSVTSSLDSEKTKTKTIQPAKMGRKKLAQNKEYYLGTYGPESSKSNREREVALKNMAAPGVSP
jgi:hypothetical protein